ncbi:MAG: zinc ABC transporter substrate-binding protein [Chloroflexota bacterium]|nr:zinc ABC transporter substrate-binding protein [Chloroflexota bacterium]
MLLTLTVLFLSVLPAFAQDVPQVVATTTILADVARNVGGALIEVSALVPADADTHAYEPTTDDVARVAQADLLLAVGVNYEEFLVGLLENAGDSIPILEVTSGVEILAFGGDHTDEAHNDDPLATPEAEHAHGAADIIGVYGAGTLECGADDHEDEAAGAEHADAHEHGACDPHVWMNPANVAIWADNIAAAFSDLDPANAATYAANAEAYKTQLTALDADIRAIVSAVPAESRILVTNHDFMGYFAAAYGFEIVATVLPGGTTGAELEPQGMAAVIELVRAEGVPAIFAEVSANTDLIDVLADEADIAVVTALYSESLSGADGAASTYLDFMRYNATTIAAALS